MHLRWNTMHRAFSRKKIVACMDFKTASIIFKKRQLIFFSQYYQIDFFFTKIVHKSWKFDIFSVCENDLNWCPCVLQQFFQKLLVVINNSFPRFVYLTLNDIRIFHHWNLLCGTQRNIKIPFINAYRKLKRFLDSRRILEFPYNEIVGTRSDCKSFSHKSAESTIYKLYKSGFSLLQTFTLILLLFI